MPLPARSRKVKPESARIDANTILVGEGQSLEDAVARMSKPAVGLQARALDRSKALADNDLWIAGTLPDLPMTVPVLDSLRSVALGITAQSDLRVELALETASPKMAEDLVSSARKSQEQQPALGAALQSEVDGSTARFRFAMEGDQLIQAVQQAIANGRPAFAACISGSIPGGARAGSASQTQARQHHDLRPGWRAARNQAGRQAVTAPRGFRRAGGQG